MLAPLYATIASFAGMIASTINPSTTTLSRNVSCISSNDVAVIQRAMVEIESLQHETVVTELTMRFATARYVSKLNILCVPFSLYVDSARSTKETQKLCYR